MQGVSLMSNIPIIEFASETGDKHPWSHPLEKSSTFLSHPTQNVLFKIYVTVPKYLQLFPKIRIFSAKIKLEETSFLETIVLINKILKNLNPFNFAESRFDGSAFCINLKI